MRYPDPDIVALDKRFEKYKLGNTSIQPLHTGMLWAEVREPRRQQAVQLCFRRQRIH
jgi:hypothetical protein